MRGTAGSIDTEIKADLNAYNLLINKTIGETQKVIICNRTCNKFSMKISMLLSQDKEI